MVEVTIKNLSSRLEDLFQPHQLQMVGHDKSNTIRVMDLEWMNIDYTISSKEMYKLYQIFCAEISKI
jgi:hypothetical protein